MLRDLFLELYPNFTPQTLFCNLRSLKQQMISARVRLLILKDTDVEERYAVFVRIAEIQRELEQQLFFYVLASRCDEVPQFRNWTERQDTTHGPLYARTFKRLQDELNMRLNMLHPLHLQPFVPFVQRPPLPHAIIFSGGPQNRPTSTDLNIPGENAMRNFNMPFLQNALPFISPNSMDFRLPMPQISANFQLPLQFHSSWRDENDTETHRTN
ncbi:unnamed protein product [Litomosoides sigmodontis]|uniref:Uncharacterized protein n=1 Tax=Litomosoides sigmodontis TaxID=42156 RepID=A0A3P6SLP6_LITSI|nr:unnamed protein product [Litomosoides sigmodontis]